MQVVEWCGLRMPNWVAPDAQFHECFVVFNFNSPFRIMHSFFDSLQSPVPTINVCPASPSKPQLAPASLSWPSAKQSGSLLKLVP